MLSICYKCTSPITQHFKIRKPSRKTRFFILFSIVVVFVFLYSSYGLSSYEFIPNDQILENLHEEVSSNLSSSAISACEYYDVVNSDITLTLSLVDVDLVDGHKIKKGGEYAPTECKPKYSIAVIIPYKDRPEELRRFLVYMHTFLRYQKIHYRIIVVEQVDSRPFNRAKLMNIGALAAMRYGFPCLVLHDVDLLPLKPANIYACTKQPRHMSSVINKFRFLLPYVELFGGAVAVTSKQYQQVNGMSNLYYGWGGEDDDLYVRLDTSGLKIVRFGPNVGIYHMGIHKEQEAGVKRTMLLKSAHDRMKMDGLNSIKYTEVATVFHPLFTHIMVDL